MPAIGVRLMFAWSMTRTPELAVFSHWTLTVSAPLAVSHPVPEVVKFELAVTDWFS
jgi:hypothetical protein